MIPKWTHDATYKYGDWVTKRSGGSWRGHIVGFYSTKLTPEGYAVESFYEPGSVQIYPVKALMPFNDSSYFEADK